MKHGVAVNRNLPFIEAADELKPKNPNEVAHRALVLHHLACLGFGATQTEVHDLLTSRDLLCFTSRKELTLITSPKLTQQNRINCSWLPECMQSLGYCLGLVNVDPFKHCDDELARHFPLEDGNRESFIKKATIRPFEDIYQQCDLHYRLHWAARESRIRGTDCKVQEGLIAERRKAIDWVVGVEEDWDQIQLDT